MVNVDFCQIDGELILSVTGHAGMDNTGKDIVCSAVSILIYTLAQRLKDIAAPKIHLKNGNAIISIKLHRNKKAVKEAFLTVKTGFLLLAENYPQCVKINTESFT